MDDTALLEFPDDPATLQRMILAERAHHAAALKERDESIQLLNQDNQLLRHRLAALLRSSYGPRAERFDPRQLLLFGLLVPRIEFLAAGSSLKPKSPHRSKHGRQKLPEHLPRLPIEHDLDESEKACPCCGEQRQRIGQEKNEQLEHLPSNFVVLEHIRHKYACSNCNSGRCQKCDGNAHIDLATKPQQPIEKGLAGPGLLAYVVTSKMADHCVRGKAVSQMRVGLSWPGDRARPQTSPNCNGKEPLWETSGLNGATRSRQVRSVKSNESEPLTTCRK